MNLTSALVAIQAILSGPELSEARDLVATRQVSQLTRFFFLPFVLSYLQYIILFFL